MRGLMRIVTLLGTGGRDYPEILKYGVAFNTSRLKSEGVTPLRANEALKINNICAINCGIKKLVVGQMGIPSVGFRGAQVDDRRNDNSTGDLLRAQKKGRSQNRVEHIPRPNGRGDYKEKAE